MASFSDLVVKLELQQAAFQKGMDQAARQMARVQASAKSAQGSMSGLEKSMQGVAVAATAVGTAFATIKGVEAIVTAADRVRQLQGSFTALLGDAGRASDMMARVFGIVDRTGAPLEAVAGATQRLSIALKDLGASNRQIETIAEAFIQLGKVGGSSAAETAAGLQQLGQALASGKLGGDELKSIRENAPLVAEAIAKGMGVTTGALKQLGEDGKLTADVVANALIAAAGAAGVAFAKLPQGFEQSLNKMEKQATLFAASFDKIGGTTTTLTTAIDFITTTLKRWTDELDNANGRLNSTQILVQSVSDLMKLVAVAVVAITFAIEQVSKRTAFWAQQLEALSRFDWDAVKQGSEDFRIQMEAAAAAASATIEALLKGQAIVKKSSSEEETGGQPEVAARKIKAAPGGGGGAGAKGKDEAEAIRKRGEALAASVDPLNAYNQKLAEYNELLAKGAISDMTFARAVEQAKAALTSVNDTMRAALDPLFAYGLEMEKLERLYQQQIITLETFKLATADAAKKYQDFLDQQKQKSPEEKLLEQAVQGTADAMGTFVGDIITGSESADKAFEKMVKSIISNLAKLLAEFAAAEATKFIIKSLFGGASAAGSGTQFGAPAPGGLMLASRPTTWNAAASLAPGLRAGETAAGATTAGAASTQSPWNVVINNNAPGVDVSASSRADGGLDVTVERVRSLLAQDVARGGNNFSRSLESAYGLGRGGR